MLERVRLPSTLKAVEPSAFKDCKSVKRAKFVDGRETFGEDAGIWNGPFRSCGVEEIVLPSTLREMPPGIFKDCKSLRVVRVGDFVGSGGGAGGVSSTVIPDANVLSECSGILSRAQ